MPLITSIHESLPYIDTEPSPSERAAALSLITQELNPSSTKTLHPALPSLASSNLSPAIQAEMTRLSSNPSSKLTAIDLTRYESLSAPPTDTTTADWQTSLRAAYTSSTYLSSRLTNLSLLEKFGKNSWLIGNSQLEDILRSLERELEERKKEIDLLVIERKTAQEAVGGEMRGLEEAWKRGVGRVLETEVAAEGLRREILERRRAGAA